MSVKVNLCDNAIDVVDLEDLFEGKYEFPLTVDEFRKFVVFNGLNPDIIDFYVDVKRYQHLYRDWKTYRKKDKNATQESLDSIAASGTIEGLNPPPVSSGESMGGPGPAPINDVSSTYSAHSKNREAGAKPPVRDLSGLRHISSIDDIEVLSESTEAKKMSTKQSVESLGKLASSKGKQFQSSDKLMRTNDSQKSHKSGKSKKVSSKAVSHLAADIFKKYLITDAEKYLYMLPDKSVTPITSHYVKAIETADKTGLRFMPSPDRAFAPMLKLSRHYMWDEEEYFPKFINFCVGNTVPSTLPNSFYQYKSSVNVIGYVQTLLFAILAGCVILMKVYGKVSRFWLAFLVVPLMLMVSTYLLATTHIGFWLWLQKKREVIILKTSSQSTNTNVPPNPDDPEGLDVTQEDPETQNNQLSDSFKIGVRRAADITARKLQNGLVLRIFGLSLATSVLITAVFVFLWPDQSDDGN